MLDTGYWILDLGTGHFYRTLVAWQGLLLLILCYWDTSVASVDYERLYNT